MQRLKTEIHKHQKSDSDLENAQDAPLQNQSKRPVIRHYTIVQRTEKDPTLSERNFNRHITKLYQLPHHPKLQPEDQQVYDAIQKNDALMIAEAQMNRIIEIVQEQVANLTIKPFLKGHSVKLGVGISLRTTTNGMIPKSRPTENLNQDLIDAEMEPLPSVLPTDRSAELKNFSFIEQSDNLNSFDSIESPRQIDIAPSRRRQMRKSQRSFQSQVSKRSKNDTLSQFTKEDCQIPLPPAPQKPAAELEYEELCAEKRIELKEKRLQEAIVLANQQELQRRLQVSKQKVKLGHGTTTDTKGNILKFIQPKKKDIVVTVPVQISQMEVIHDNMQGVYDAIKSRQVNVSKSDSRSFGEVDDIHQVQQSGLSQISEKSLVKEATQMKNYETNQEKKNEKQSQPLIVYRGEVLPTDLAQKVGALQFKNQRYAIIAEADIPIEPFNSNVVPKAGITQSVHLKHSNGDKEVSVTKGPQWQSNQPSRRSLKEYRELFSNQSRIGPITPLGGTENSFENKTFSDAGSVQYLLHNNTSNYSQTSRTKLPAIKIQNHLMMQSLLATPAELKEEFDQGVASPGVWTLRQNLDKREPSISKQSKVNLLPYFSQSKTRLQSLNMLVTDQTPRPSHQNILTSQTSIPREINKTTVDLQNSTSSIIPIASQRFLSLDFNQILIPKQQTKALSSARATIRSLVHQSATHRSKVRFSYVDDDI